MRRITNLLVLAMACSSAGAQTGAGEFVYGKDHASFLEAPKGWVLDAADAAKDNAGSVFIQ